MLLSIHFGSSMKAGSGCLLVIKGVCSCLLPYFEYVLIVIHQVADGESSELCGERICSGTNDLSLGWAVQNS